MDTETVWRHIRDERRALAATLATLDDAEWATPSLCEGWTVKDVAAHVIASPTFGWVDFLVLMARNGFSFDRAVLRDGQRRGRAPAAQILAEFEKYDGSRALPPTTTPLEPLLDILVHTQDALRPLGRRHEMPPDAAAAAADRALARPQFLGRPALSGIRLVATDVDWSHGSGPEVRAPMQELLMLAAGRAASADLVEGEGIRRVRVA